jgi:thiamine kinase-like enzyme
MSAQSPSQTELGEYVTPSNAALPNEFYSSFNISTLHVQINNASADNSSSHIPERPMSPSSISLFDDLHVDHNLANNIDLMYEVLYQASKHVPSWKTIPFEVFCNIVEIKPLLGGFSNFLVSIELREEYLTDPYLQSQRPETLKTIIANIDAAIKNNDNVNVPVLDNPNLLRPLSQTGVVTPSTPTSIKPIDQNTVDIITSSIAATSVVDLETQTSEVPVIIAVSSLGLQDDLTHLDIEHGEYIYVKPAITKVACRIYGTSEFTNRSCELGLAKAASDKEISEFVYCSWRHGRITSFLDGSSLGSTKWFDPILSSICGYIQGNLHAQNFQDCFKGTSLQPPSTEHPHLHSMLKNWCKKSLNTKLYRSINHHEGSRVSSVFDMFTADDNSLYVINRPSCAVKTRSIRCDSLILPLPTILEPFLIPLLNAYQVDTPETEPIESSYFNFPHRSQRTTKLEHFDCVKTGLITLEDKLTPKQLLEGEIAELYTTTDSHGQKVEISNYTIPLPPSRVLTIEESELITEYLDLPRMMEEIKWFIEQCHLFPVVTSHNDYHSGNVLLLNSLLQTQYNESTTYNQAGHVISASVKSLSGDSTATIHPEQDINVINPEVQLAGHPLTLPNSTLDWIKVIDFEYGGLNYRGYDTANSSNESWIVYDGSHPGFTLDIPAWVSTAFLGKYDKNVVNIDPTQHEDCKDDKYTCFDHCYIPTIYSQDKLDDIVKVWNQKEDAQIGKNIQHILLGKYASKKYSLDENAPAPTFRPREVMWVEACLTGFYHATRSQHYKNCPEPETTPIYPFQTTSPPQKGFDDKYQLPATLEEWLEDQVPKLLYETMILQLASMLAWSAWGVIFTQASVGEGFGYLEHALARMVAYVAKKELMIQLGLLKSPYKK